MPAMQIATKIATKIAMQIIGVLPRVSIGAIGCGFPAPFAANGVRRQRNS